MLPEHRYSYSSHRAACKQWSAGLGVLILLIGALAGLNPTKMLWAAGPLLLIGLVEAGYAAQERRYAELLKANPSVSSGQAPSAGSGQGALLPEAAGASVARTTLAALSLSIWPFYLGLFAIVGIGGEEMAASNKKVLVSNGPAPGYAPAEPSGARWLAAGNPEGSAGGRWQMVRPVALNSAGAGCGSGGCGTTAGCGSGGCGASAGKGCSCGGGAVTAQQARRPVQPYVQTNTGPMPYQGGYQPMPQGQMVPQPVQYQRLPNGAIVNARPPTVAMNPALVRAQPGAALMQPAVNAGLPVVNPNASVSPAQVALGASPPAVALSQPPLGPGNAPSAVIDAPLQNAVPAPVAAPAVANPPPAPGAAPTTPDAASKKKH